MVEIVLLITSLTGGLGTTCNGTVGMEDGAALGMRDGAPNGITVGSAVGWAEGATDGTPDGTTVGRAVGWTEGDTVITFTGEGPQPPIITVAPAIAARNWISFRLGCIMVESLSKKSILMS